MSNLFYYRVIVEDGNGKMTYRNNGLIAAEDYGDAANRITEYYSCDSDYISTIAIEEWENPCELTDCDVHMNYYKERHWNSDEPTIKLED